MTQLTLHIAEKSYANGVCTLRDLHLSAASGEFVAIVGPSGTGKTTLLNIVAGLEQATQGEVLFDSQVRKPAARDIGFMFQEPRLMPWLTLEENLLLLATRRKAGAKGNNAPADFTQRLDKLLAQVSLQDFRQAYPRELSGGMQRRTALVRAFIGQPELLLMDEPFQSLDAPTANQLRQLLLDLWEATQATVLFVTHSLSEALTLADRVVFLSDRPAKVILNYPVDANRPRILSAVNAMQEALLAEHPELLSGRAAVS